MESSPEKFLDTASMAEGADIIELRADGLRKPTPEAVKSLIKEVKQKTSLPIILTVRTKKEGGAFSGSESERKSIILASLPLADFIDIELRTEKKMRDELVKNARGKRTRVIISYHDFSSTPEKAEVLSIIREELSAGADIAKIAFQAKSERDAVRLLEAASEGSKLGDVCAISMGDIGKHTRVTAPIFGSVITYGYVTKQTAQGQFSVNELKNALEILGLRK